MVTILYHRLFGSRRQKGKSGWRKSWYLCCRI